VLPSASSLRRLLIALVTFAFLAVALSAPVTAKVGNSANAKLCQKGGWENWVRQDQTPFANQDDCVAYTAMGGRLTVPAAHLTLSPSSWDAGIIYAFGDPQSATQTFTLTNDGGASSEALTVDVAFGRWSQSNDTCTGTSLDPGASCTFDVTVTAALVNGTYCGSGAYVNEVAAIEDVSHPSYPGILTFFLEAHCG
jgi:hypothetical protein